MKKRASKVLEKVLGEKPSFAMALRAYRTREDLTQSELAEILGVKKSYISNLENKRDFVTLEQAIKFANAFKEPVTIWMRWAIQDMIDRTGESVEVGALKDKAS